MVPKVESRSKRGAELVGLVAFALSLMLLIALATFDPRDPAPFFKAGAGESARNFIGPFGAFLAELLIPQLFGLAALLLPLAVPTYIVAYAYLDLLHPIGPVQTLIRDIFGIASPRDFRLPDIRSLPGIESHEVEAMIRDALGDLADRVTIETPPDRKRGGSVSLVGFGTFAVTKRAARSGRNPRTGAAIKIKAAKVPKFRPGKGLKDAM